RAAVRTLGRSQVTEAQIIQSLRAIAQVVTSHRSKFAAALDNQKATESRASNERLGQIQSQLAEIDQNLQELLRQKQQRQKELSDAQTDLSKIEGRYAVQQRQYELASDTVNEQVAQLLQLAA